ncbi:hypothetical protein [Xanthomonas translucens]|jgi:hypothetical protein|uniref:hypothetical protein n=1 Tax=Xanthomonas campestris pv. translucens TaxID=343 RepID=UPI0021B75BEB|nr:hypothetical protein [Xanthomonas translucens]MCT8275828.1 hypothetical protein [Xanthomonas translucens pv. translucens]MCT8278618.1 hypothetical protein [Xanthomonas translucens pv. translucens]WLA10150.1 hypothetical protein MO328_08645 [Xanthomonas translucens]WNJ27661.1 hypothetical protein RMA73_03205 [Xanthomonas translucens pv. translucens]
MDQQMRGKSLLQIFWKNKFDFVMLFVSVLVAGFTIYMSSRKLAVGQDANSRMNAIFLGLLVISWLVGLCGEIKVRTWGTFLSIVGFVVFFLSMAASSRDAWIAFKDIFRA